MIMVSFRIERTGQVEVRLKVEGIHCTSGLCGRSRPHLCRDMPLPSKIAKSATSCLMAAFFLPPFLWTFDDKGSYYRRHRYRRDSRLLRISVGNECYS